ncbi:YbhB/YbcL family Raf kinase inhibitor-like protein [Actinomadura miaoliensis]|uniref:YbhB/YbcL family Raf kinase inhibitor-like protein n=1 Tax=Actinomadura miaoliensis TaxID=430685 RepID=A0ABP7WWT1_9ACTN
MDEIRLRSPAFSDHTLIPADHSHAQGDVSPPLEWSDVPDAVTELVLICEDPDAPGGTFVHWLLAGIDPGTESIDAGDVPTEAAVGRNDFGSQGYGGPHPPVGDEPHRYFFRLYGLSEASGLKDGFTGEDFRTAVEEKVIASGTLVGTYGR